MLRRSHVLPRHLGGAATAAARPAPLVPQRALGCDCNFKLFPKSVALYRRLVSFLASEIKNGEQELKRLIGGQKKAVHQKPLSEITALNRRTLFGEKL